MSKHTPGPWVVDGNDISPAHNISLGICAISPVDMGGAKVWHHGPETYANANLIAAAPDLLEAIESIMTNADPRLMSAGQRDLAIAAIKKARGEQC